MEIKINIDDYLSHEEKKQLCIDYVKEVLRGDERHRERVLSNMAYNAAYAIIDDSLTQKDFENIKERTIKAIKNFNGFGIFRKKDAWGSEDSVAYLEVKRAVEEHKHLIKPLVKKAILEKNYSDELPDAAGYIGDCIVDAIKKGLGA